MQDHQVTSTYSSSSSARLRPQTESTRRTSNLSAILSDDLRLSNTSTSIESDRDRHWNTILGHPPHSSVSDFNTQTTFTSDDRSLASLRTVLPPKSPHYRSSTKSKATSVLTNTPGSSSKRSHIQTSTDNPSSTRQQKTTPPKPFACDQCGRRFERKGHLKVRWTTMICAVLEKTRQFQNSELEKIFLSGPGTTRPFKAFL